MKGIDGALWEGASQVTGTEGIWGGILRREPAALERLIDCEADGVFHLIRQILGRRGTEEDVEETAADAFTAVWRDIGDYDTARGSFRSWVLMKAKYAALERRRRLRRRSGEGERPRLVPLPPQLPADTAAASSQTAAPETAAVEAETREHLHRTLDRMPPAQRDLLVRRYFYEETAGELADDLGISTDAVYNRLWRARNALRQRLQEEGEVSSSE